jgi:hypothetical protein
MVVLPILERQRTLDIVAAGSGHQSRGGYGLVHGPIAAWSGPVRTTRRRAIRYSETGVRSAHRWA